MRLLTRNLSRNLEHCSCQGVGNAEVIRSNYEYICTVTNTITIWIFNRTNTKQPRWTQEAREGWKCSTASTHLINSLHREVECHEFTDGPQASLWKTKKYGSWMFHFTCGGGGGGEGHGMVKKQEEQLHLDDSHSNAKPEGKKSLIFLKYTSVTQSILCTIFLMYVL